MFQVCTLNIVESCNFICNRINPSESIKCFPNVGKVRFKELFNNFLFYFFVRDCHDLLKDKLVY